ncbi:MAG TPA: hypothetical protein PK185_05980 [Cyclobacteriaceae bacterium]|nr:hypothetical protein [Cyclobacteriaceae bacterium]HRK53441.1 hypothetical protein [Cyclobacteriaceae bacterium]
MESHKRILGILYIISGALQMIFIFGLSMFISTVLAFAMREVDPGQEVIIELITSIFQFLPAVIIIFFSIPAIIAGIGLLYKQSWALVMALILGCFKLFSFPIGTALGVYTIWVYVEQNKQSKETL